MHNSPKSTVRFVLNAGILQPFHVVVVACVVGLVASLRISIYGKELFERLVFSSMKYDTLFHSIFIEKMTRIPREIKLTKDLEH
jgi:hypothetical protein